MVRILVFTRLYNLSDEQIEYQLLDRMHESIRHLYSSSN
ncbi:MAG: transposase [Limnohabitans sp.]|jgi:hypothetical protein